jgi:hypothetical protein
MLGKQVLTAVMRLQQDLLKGYDGDDSTWFLLLGFLVGKLMRLAATKKNWSVA